MAINEREAARKLAHDRMMQQELDESDARWAAAAPAAGEATRLEAEEIAAEQEAKRRYDAEVVAIRAHYGPRIEQARRAAHQAQGAWAQQQQAEQAEQARRRQVDTQARQVAAQRQAVQQAVEEARRRGLTLEAYLASLERPAA